MQERKRILENYRVFDIIVHRPYNQLEFILAKSSAESF